MTTLRRRTFLCGSTAVSAVAVGGSWAAAPVFAASTEPHEAIVRDAHLHWNSVPRDWRSAPLLGNGVLWGQVHRSADGRGLTVALGGASTPWEAPDARLALVLAGTPTEARWELDLWNAELTGTLTTTRGSVRFAALVPRSENVLMISLTPSEGESRAAWVPDEDAQASWCERRQGSRRIVTASLDAGPPRDVDGPELVESHRAWWNSFYRRSFLSIPDKTVQRFHWAQLYRAAATRPGGEHATAMLDGYGHAAWAAPSTPTHARAAIPGTGSKEGFTGNMIAAAGLPALWRHCVHSGDDELLRETVRPALRRAVGFYGQFLVEDAGGRLHLPLTHSPTYADVHDSTYDLELLRWAARALVRSSTLLGVRDPRGDRWNDIGERLVRAHRDVGGAPMVGAGVALGESHRHPSHLVALHQLDDLADSHDRAVWKRGFECWSALRDDWQGHSHLAAAAMSSALNDGDAARAELEHVLAERVGDSEFLPNTLYRAGGAAPPDVGYAVSRILRDMMTRWRGDVVDLFPAVPAGWADVSVSGLEVRQGIRVDAGRSGGRTEWVRVHSGTDRAWTLRHGINGPVTVRDGRGRRIHGGGRGPAEVRVAPRAHGAVVVVERTGFEGGTEPRDVTASGSGRRWGSPAVSRRELI
ncbi:MULTISPECIES: hypothetical protein [unclassified Saccharopolyspora]|uniref:glycosyl hydrolase family 95 catalytic domain-containing protein n=1 Tax=unclassified Saccharopolyspora TaxID=2646250 RepID=UPI001CD4D4A1|nr:MULTISPECIES: hypothetical protein [unclassified Saccharopolyspora]MCA1185141.1 hypothetical protein [Saccharopolyspora sp. 6T]MCA1278493.1 hypothetical protein [Saccharopolyspora sp. 7B]